MLHKNDHSQPASKDEVVAALIPAVFTECSLVAFASTTADGVLTLGPGASPSPREGSPNAAGTPTCIPCSPGPILQAVSAAVDEAPPSSTKRSPVDILHRAKKKTHCDTEKCVLEALKDPIVRAVGQEAFIGNLANNFKVEGPLDSTWLTNTNIDTVMKQWMAANRRFFAYNFNMRNYMDYSFQNSVLCERPDTLATVSFDSLHKQGFDCAACVVNGDVYQNGGTHWMAIFVDARKPPKATCEFFNSAGTDPAPEFVSYLVKSADCIRSLGVNRRGQPTKWTADVVKVTRRRHQQSTTECGLYSLFYVWARLNGVPYGYFLDNPVSDQLMFEFRHHLFAGAEVGGRFDWADFNRRVAVEWERGT